MILTVIKAFLLAGSLILFACNGTGQQAVFSNGLPESKEYKDELAKRIASDPDGFTYTFNNYLKRDGRNYLEIDVEGESFSAKGLVLVNHWNKLEGIKAKNGLGYSGAELRGLKLAIQANASGAELIYKDLEKVID